MSRSLSRLTSTLATMLNGSNLKSRVLRGGAWLGTGSVAEQAFRLARNVLLARLLAPSAFGTMALILSINSVLQALTEIGVREAIIQNPRGGQPRYINMAWWMTFGRASGTYIALFIAAPLVAKFYASPMLTNLLRVALVGLVLEGAVSAKAYIKLKELRFSRWAAIMHGGGICGIVVTVILSFFIRDVWALVLGSVSESATRLLLSYVLCPFVPQLQWNINVLRDLLKFSRGLFGLSVLNLIFSRADVFVLGKLITPTNLGLYTMAVYLVLVPSGFVMSLMGQLLVPAFAKIQGDQLQTNLILKKFSLLIFVLGSPLLPFLYFCGRSLLTIVYGQTYSVQAGALSIAVVVALINILNAGITAVFFANGRPELHRRGVAVMAATMLVLIYPLARWLGPLGGQVSCLIAVTGGFALQAERIRHLTGFRFGQYGNMALSALGPTIIVAAICLLNRFLGNTSSATTVAVGLFACFTGYAIAAWRIVVRPLQLTTHTVDHTSSSQFAC